jgi:hypothetical protein
VAFDRTLRQEVQIKFAATPDQVFKAFPAIANLADTSGNGKVSIGIVATNADGFDPALIRNGVDERLDEAEIQRQ